MSKSKRTEEGDVLLTGAPPSEDQAPGLSNLVDALIEHGSSAISSAPSECVWREWKPGDPCHKLPQETRIEVKLHEESQRVEISMGGVSIDMSRGVALMVASRIKTAANNL